MNKKKKNSQHNVEHYNSKLNEGHAVVAEQKIRELNRLKNFKRLNKIEKKTLKPNKVLKKATASMNLHPTRKYKIPPDKLVKKSTESEENKLTCDFPRLKKVDKDADTYSRFDRKSDKKSKKNYKITFIPGRRRTSLSLF